MSRINLPYGGSGAVSSVFTRTGAVAATAGDYTGVAVGGTADAVAALGVTNAMVSASAAIAISKLADPGAGKVVGSSSGAAAVFPPGFEVTYDQITTGVAVISTTEGTPTTIIAGSSKTYENVPYTFEFGAYFIQLPSTTGGFVYILLIQDGASVGRIGYFQNDVTGGQTDTGALLHTRFTPTAGAHTFGIASYCSATTGGPTIGAGAGGSGVGVPAFIRATKV